MVSAVTEGPNIVHPEKASAVGSRNSLHRSGRDEYRESKFVVDEEIDKILNHIDSKLPPEVLSKLNISSSVKELLHNYFNQGLQNMLNRYLTTTEDEISKKFRDFVDVNEQEGLNKYTPVGIPALLDRIGGEEKFNTNEIEKSTVNIYGHLQGHVQRGQYELEQDTNSILRQKVDIGAFIRGENTHSIIKCAFKDSFAKPETVTDISLSINILDSELISPIYHYQNPVKTLLSYLISDTIINHIDHEVDKLNSELVDQGKSEFTDNEALFERLKIMEQSFVSSNGDAKELGTASNSREMRKIGNKIVEIVKGVPNEISKFYSDPTSVKDNIIRLLDAESARNRGFNTAVNSITAILDTSRMGYQFIENNKNARRLTIREYEDQEAEILPDENYKIVMHYLDTDQLRESRIAYAQQFNDFEDRVTQIWSVVQEIYQEIKKDDELIDYGDIKEEYLGEKNKGGVSKFLKLLGISDSEEEEEEEQIWDEIIFVQPDDSDIEKANATFKESHSRITNLFNLVRQKMQDVFNRSYPLERICVEERVDDLERAFAMFYQSYNPFHCQPGLNIQINISTIKRKKITMKSMSNVLNEFLSGVSKEFHDKAFANFSRRRSTDTTSDYEEFTSYESPASVENTETANNL